MSKIKIFSLGGLNENGKNTYIVEIDEKIFILVAGLKSKTRQPMPAINPKTNIVMGFNSHCLFKR